MGNSLLSKVVRTLFLRGKQEHFEDGMESEFSRRLVSLIEIHGEETLALISSCIKYNIGNSEFIGEALIWIGNIEHPPTYEARFNLLIEALSSPSPRIRDGATIGLSYLDDINSIPYVKEAIANETWIELKKDLNQLLTQLNKNDD